MTQTVTLTAPHLVGGRGELTVTLPDRRNLYPDLFAKIRTLGRDDPEAHVQWMRTWMAADLYFLGLVSSQGEVVHPYYPERPGVAVPEVPGLEIDCDFLFEFSREIQFDSDKVIDKGSRLHWKSSWKAFLEMLRQSIINPNLAAAFFSFEVAAAQKHCWRLASEVVNHPELYCAYLPDVFGPWVDLKGSAPKPIGSPTWDQRKGCVLPGRTWPNLSPSWGAYTFLGKLPTGGRITHFMVDDVETERTVGSDDQRKQTRESFLSMLRLQGHGPWKSINGTHHSTIGLLTEIEGLPGWEVRNRICVDVGRRPPEIPEIDPLTGRAVDPVIRAQPLEGDPVLLHPIQLAELRATHEKMGKLDEYYMHYFGDIRKAETKRLHRGWIQWYDESPTELAARCNGYICEDTALGRAASDPSYLWVWGVDEHGNYNWLDAIRRRLSPGERLDELVNLVRKWKDYLLNLEHLRIEEYSQADFVDPARARLEDEKLYYECYRIADNRGGSERYDAKTERAWRRWEPPARAGKIRFPKCGILRRTDSGAVENLVDLFLEKEWDPFPNCKEDHGLDAGGLIFHMQKELPPVRTPAPLPLDDDYYGSLASGHSWRSA